MNPQVNDLSLIHHPITSLFKIPLTSSEWDKYRLNEDQIRQFKELGYVSDIKMLDNNQIESLRNELQELVDPQHPAHSLFHEFHSNESSDRDKILFHALGHWRISASFHDVLWNPAFVMAAYQLLEGPVRFWHDQIFYKPAKDGGVVAWHQDYSYWTRTVPMQHLTCWIGLDDANIANGCINYIPQSHKWGLLKKPALAGNMNEVLNFLTEEQKHDFNPVAIEMKKGYATFHHPLLLHGSYGNTTDIPRRAFVLNVFKDGTLSDTNESLLKGVPSVKKGEVLEGQFFPLLFNGPDSSFPHAR